MEMSDALMNFLTRTVERQEQEISDLKKVNNALKDELLHTHDKYVQLLDELYDATKTPTFDLAFVKKAVGYPPSSNIEAEYERTIEETLAKDVGESGEAI